MLELAASKSLIVLLMCLGTLLFLFLLGILLEALNGN